VRHAAACEDAGIAPIFGATLTVHESPLVLLCADSEGYANLCDLLTLAHGRAALSGDRSKPILRFEELRPHAKGLFCLTGDHDGALSGFLEKGQWSRAREWTAELQSIFGDRLRIELTHHERPGDNERLRHLIELSQTLSIPAVATNAIRYATPAEYAVFDALTCMRLGLSVGQWHRQRPRNARAYLCGETRLLKLGMPEQAILNTESMARECRVEIMPGRVTPPETLLPEGVSAKAFLQQLCTQGLKARGLSISRAAKTQLKREVEVVCHLELEEFFLTVREVVAFARSRGIRCCGRGSAANSLIAYLLGITEVDPLRHHLLFERFLHEGRRGMPDIDVDFDSARRGEVINWMSQRWGDAHTAMTANTNTFRLRSAVRDMGKVLGYPLPLLDKATKHLPRAGVRHAGEFRAELSQSLGDGVALDVLLGLCAALHDGREACPRHLSLHSGGMILSRQSLRHISPIQTSANGVRQVQFNKDDVERLGLIKFDVLGLRMLSVVSEATQLLESVGEAAPDVDTLPDGDPKTYEMICSGQTLGVFQIESPGQWNLLARSQPENFDDLVAQVALFRPGPLQGGMVHPYIARRRGWQKVSYPHPCLEPVLRDSYGIILFQEQVLEVAHVFAGMNLSQADEFRRLMSKERDRAEMEAMREKFVGGAIKAHQASPFPVSSALASRVFDLVSKFVGYGFCRSHAAAFARTVYQSSYLKAHHPAAYLAAVLEHKPGFYPLHTLLEEARLQGVKVLPPCIHRSGVRYSLERLGDDTKNNTEDNPVAIRVPLTQVQELGAEPAARLVLERAQEPFGSLDDLFRRVALSPQAWDNLARSGALASFGERRQVLWHLGRLARMAGAQKKARGQLFLGEQTLGEQVLLPVELPVERVLSFPLAPAQETAWDFATLGLTTGPHPLALQRPHLQKLGARTIGELFALPTGSSVLVAGAVISRQRPPTAKGFCFLILEDETGRLPTALAPQNYEKFERVLREPGLLIEGKLEAPPEEKKGGKTGVYRSILIERLWSLGEVVGTRPLHGAQGHPGESPRASASLAARA
jgi:error-prone DNA polymerase